MASRVPIRFLTRHARYGRRNFSTSSSAFGATNFTMPAMSPTMTEGNISSWKVKEGDSFSAGDILLEIETDKATMDVEAQDDGIMAKIFQGDGSKAVKVGSRIAVLAEPGDDISSLNIPEDTSSPVSSAAENVSRAKEETKQEDPAIKGTPENKRPSRDRPKTSPTGPGQNPKYPLYPSVQALIHQNHISDADVQKIPATGPQGRLLKGDVLAYLGSIESDYSKQQSERIEKNSHLDLSNIKVAQQAPTKPALGTEATTPEVPQETTIAIPISLAEVLKTQARMKETLNVTLPLSTFLSRAVDFANDDLPKSKRSKPTQEELFNAVLGLDAIPTTSRGTYLPQIDAVSPISSTATQIGIRANTTAAKPDIIDVLTGNIRPARSAAIRTPTLSSSTSTGPGRAKGATNVFSVTVPLGEEKRARVFLERMKTVLQVEPGRLVL